MRNSISPSRPNLYSLASYDRSAKARWLLAELGVDFEEKRLSREAKEPESLEYLRINPMGSVPTLKVDDVVLFESGAICAYLADLYLDKGLAPALDSPARAGYQQWMYFASATLDTIQTRIMVIEDIPAGEVRKEKEARLLSDLRDALEALDRPLEKASHLVADQLSAADICVSYHLYMCMLWPELEAVVRGFPRVVAYLERMKKVPSAIQAQAFSFPG